MELTSAQRERTNAVLHFAKSRLSAGAREREAAGTFDRKLWDEAAAFGLAGLPIPEEWGGSGLDAVDTMLVVEALGKGCEDGGLVFSLCAHMFASAVPIWRSRSREHHERYLRDLAAGKIICANATTEPDAGSDVYAMKATARRDGGDYVLDGIKCFITNAPVADLFLVYATSEPGRGFFGVSAFLVPRDTAGLRVTPEHSKTGLKTSPWGTVYLDGCRVPAGARLGPEGSGAMLFSESMVWERACLFAYYVGAMERSLERCVEHVRTRVQFGHRIGEFQSVSNRIVDMKLRLETSRLLLYRAGELHRAGKRCDEAVALSKLWISEAALQSGLDAIQLFGGGGMATDTGVDALARDSIPARVFSGTSEMQRAIIARMLGLP
ncbi:MAG TPA: acyl-CoA dehydrogenase family protein [Anaeromyxobacteraceae bacterium]|nr:acyl-CoA dehydrogenase family protein [Anaeromyxobacteraceae bacterium]